MIIVTIVIVNIVTITSLGGTLKMNNKEENLGYLLNKATRMLKGKFNEQLKEYHLTASQWAVLKDVTIQEEMDEKLKDTSPAAISHRLYVNRPTMTGIIERLVKGEWVEAKTNLEDRRSQIISLTEKTKCIIEELDTLGDEAVEQALQGFNSEDVNRFKVYLQNMIENL